MKISNELAREFNKAVSDHANHNADGSINWNFVDADWSRFEAFTEDGPSDAGWEFLTRSYLSTVQSRIRQPEADLPLGSMADLI
jgi:hypothetical protein